MRHKTLILVLTGATGAFAEGDQAKAFLTSCPFTPSQATCVLKSAETRASLTSTPRAAETETEQVTPGPWQQEVQLRISNGANAVVGRIDVPAGMQLGIEFVTASANVPAGQTVRISLGTTVRKVQVSQYIPIVKQDWPDVGGNDWLLASSPLHAYADPPGVAVIILRPQTAGEAAFSVVISGYLLPLTQPTSEAGR